MTSKMLTLEPAYSDTQPHPMHTWGVQEEARLLDEEEVEIREA